MKWEWWHVNCIDSCSLRFSTVRQCLQRSWLHHTMFLVFLFWWTPPYTIPAPLSTHGERAFSAFHPPWKNQNPKVAKKSWVFTHRKKHVIKRIKIESCNITFRNMHAHPLPTAHNLIINRFEAKVLPFTAFLCVFP